MDRHGYIDGQLFLFSYQDFFCSFLLELPPYFYMLPRDMHDDFIYSRLGATRVIDPWLIAYATALLDYLHGGFTAI